MKKLIVLFVLMPFLLFSQEKYPADSLILKASVDLFINELDEALSYFEIAKNNNNISPNEKIRLNGWFGQCYFKKREYENAVKFFTLYYSSLQKSVNSSNYKIQKTIPFYFECILEDGISRFMLDDKKGAYFKLTNNIAEINKIDKFESNDYLIKILAKTYFIRGCLKLDYPEYKDYCADFNKSADYGNKEAFESLKKYCK